MWVALLEPSRGDGSARERAGVPGLQVRLRPSLFRVEFTLRVGSVGGSVCHGVVPKRVMDPHDNPLGSLSAVREKRFSDQRFCIKAFVLDWDDLRFFLAIARHGSPDGGREGACAWRSRPSGVAWRRSNPTCRSACLHRTPEGYRLTLAGESVKAQAERVEAEALTVERTVGGQDEKLQGVVRITCTETHRGPRARALLRGAPASPPGHPRGAGAEPGAGQPFDAGGRYRGPPRAVGSQRPRRAPDRSRGVRALRVPALSPTPRRSRLRGGLRRATA